MSRGVWVLGALVFVSQLAWAQSDEVDPDTGRKVKYQEREEIIFEGVSLHGELVGPDLIGVKETRRPVFNPLVRLREDWNPEMKASVDQVK
jgi:hypothetical protein